MATLTKEPPPSSSSTPEDDALKRNTDCVYFLASPLTCKKGSECEYRHSEYARVNPRDCWYWLNGNCLNPKCAFRHPPLDSLMGSQAGSFSGASIPAPPTPAAPVVPQNPAKQAVPCIFFQKGYCLKGDRCPFMHGPVPLGNKAQQVSASTPVTDPPTKPAFGGLEKCTQPKVNNQANVAKKVVENRTQTNTIQKVETSQPRDGGVSTGRRGPPTSTLIEEAPKYTVPSVDNERSRSRATHVHRASSLEDHSFQNGRDADESLRESSPGFDVLVDDKLRGDEYYQHEDQFGRMRAHDGRSLNEFEMNRFDDYNNSVVDVDSELYHNRRGYDSYDSVPERYAWEQRRASSERSPGEPAQYDRRSSYKSESPDFVPNSDLRRRLSKQRRVNGLKSVVSSDYHRDNQAEVRSYRSSHRDHRHSPTHESSRGSRLQGRIKLPRSSPPISGGNMHPESRNSRGRNWGRSSPSRPQIPTQQGRLRDRLRERNNEDNNEGRISRGPTTRRDSINDNATDFAGPKSLAELKGGKQTDSNQQHLKSQQSVSGGKLRDTVLAGSAGSECDLSFAGPKPLSEILKRKRDGGISGGTNAANKENNQNGNKEDDPISSDVDSAAHTKKPRQAQVSEEENNKPVVAEGDEEEGEILNKKMKLAEGEASVSNEKEQPNNEEGLKEADGDEHEHEHEHELEHGHEEEYDQGDGEYEYEQYDGEGYNDEDFMDEDDGDDFAKKLGVSI